MSGALQGRALEAALIEHIGDIVAEFDVLKDALASVNDPELRRQAQLVTDLAPLLQQAHGVTPGPDIAEALEGLRKLTQGLRLPARDPELGATPALRRLREAKGLILAATDEALAVAAELGWQPVKDPLSNSAALVLRREESATEIALIANRLDVVMDRLDRVEQAGREPTNFVIQRGLVNLFVPNMKLEASLARADLTIDAGSVDINAVVRPIVAMGELTQAFAATVKAWATRVTAALSDSSDALRDGVRRLIAGVRAVVRVEGGADEPVSVGGGEPIEAIEDDSAAGALDWIVAERIKLNVAVLPSAQPQIGKLNLASAVAAYRHALDQATDGMSPPRWEVTQNTLAHALAALDQRQEAAGTLRAVFYCFESALGWPGSHVNRAMTNNNLGVALQMLGEGQTEQQWFAQAVAAARTALKELSGMNSPRDRAMIQHNLGCALVRLGGRESGPRWLEEAIEILRAALAERTRARVPLDWAMTQNSLGNALSTLGERESGTARLEEAVTAYRAALEEHTRARVPLDWAMTQNNLGLALWTLGERESGTARLEESVTAYRAALEERTRARVPPDWAQSQYNLANALATLAERTGDRARMTEAITSMRNAAAVDREGNNTYWGPIAERRVTEMEATLAKMPR